MSFGWLRFRLGTLMAIVSVAAVWCAFQGNRARFERQVQREVAACGGRIGSNRTDWLRWPNGKIISASIYERCMVRLFGRVYIRSVEVSNQTMPPDGLDRILQLPHLDSLRLYECGLSDRHLYSLDEATGLVNLDVSGNSALTDEGLRGLSELHDLRYLNLEEARVTDETLWSIAHLPNLVGLSVSHAKITGQGVHELASKGTLTRFSALKCPVCDEFLATVATCSQLEDLHLSGSKITDRGIASLNGHPNLRQVRLGGGRLTDAALDEFINVPKLKGLSVRGFATTFEARLEFRAKRPEVDVR